MFSRRKLAAVAAVISIALVAAACGGGDGAPAATTAPKATTAPPTAMATPRPTAPPVELITKGKEKFITCSACHGADAKGVTGLGKALVASEFVKGKTDADLVAFIKTGRPTSDPANTTGVDMPPKGGNPALTDDDLKAIVSYIRSLAP